MSDYLLVLGTVLIVVAFYVAFLYQNTHIKKMAIKDAILQSGQQVYAHLQSGNIDKAVELVQLFLPEPYKTEVELIQKALKLITPQKTI